MNFVKVSKDSGDSIKRVDWKFNETPEIEGTILEFKENIGQFNKCVWNLETPEGEHYSIWESAVLKKLLLKVTVGSYVKIVFLGKKKSAKGTSMYNDFDVFVADASAMNNNRQKQETKVPEYNGSVGQNFAEEEDDVPF